MLLQIYDNGGRTLDRYTVIIDKKIYKMSADGAVNVFARNVDEDEEDFSYLGTPCAFPGSLPMPLQQAIAQRYNSEDEQKDTAFPVV